MEYDYVIVGGGSAGCVLAARLSEDPAVSVCLVEAGGGGDSALVRLPLLAATMISGRPPINNWAFRTVPQPGLNGRRGYQPRGKALGGSSAINAMLYVRGHPRDYDEWADLGCDGWDWASVLPYFKKAEGNTRGADDRHGAGGPLKVSDQSGPHAISHAFVEAAEQVQIRPTTDFNGPRQEGAGLFQVTQFGSGPHRGERCSAFAAYLRDQRARPNLTILTKARTRQVLFDGTQATGILVRRGRRDERITARREVILSAGSFGSPQLLLLSGIGPVDELHAHGIAPRVESPGVGANLQDHLDYILAHRSLRRDVLGLNPRGLARLWGHWRRWTADRTGPFATPFAEGGAFVRSEPGLDRPDLQLHFVPGIVDNHLRTIRLADGFSCHVCVLRPQSRGTVGLTSSDPAAPPRIDPAFLSDPRDLALLMTGARTMDALLRSDPLSPWRGDRLYPHDGSDAALERDIRNRADTIYHPVGTCRMGRDPEAVTDPEGRVTGATGLRVCDASLMPRLVGGNTNAPVIMMAEKIADAIRGRVA